MPVVKLTIQEVQKACPESGHEAIYRDTEVTGFSLKVTPSNSKIFFFQYRIGGRAGITRKIKIGKFPAVKPDEARKVAMQYAAEVARKLDPQERLKKETNIRLKSHENAFGKLFETYSTKQLSQNRSGAEAKRLIEREFFPTLKNTAINSVDRADISKIINRIYVRDAPYAANRTLSFVKTFFRWAVGEGYLQGDPTSGMQKPFKGESARERVLSADEIKVLWKQFEELKYPFDSALKLLLLTGQRRDEVGSVRWQDLDLSKGLWLLPRDFTKNKLPHQVPLQGMALDIIKDIPKQAFKDEATNRTKPSEYVFTTTGKTPISGWSKIKDRIEEASIDNKTKVKDKIKDWRIHDLRRTVSSNLGDLGYHDGDIGMLLNHQSRGVTAVYNRSAYLDKKKEMLEKWEEKLVAII